MIHDWKDDFKVKPADIRAAFGKKPKPRWYERVWKWIKTNLFISPRGE